MLSSTTDKRKKQSERTKREANKVVVNHTILMDNCHDYMSTEEVKLTMMDEEEFSDQPVTPSKPPPSKKGKSNTNDDVVLMYDVA